MLFGVENIPWADYGLLGIVLLSVLSGIGWAGVRILGKDGLAERSLTTLNTVNDCLGKHHETSMEHYKVCTESNAQVDRMHDAAMLALDEIAAVGKQHGIDLTEPCNRVRRELTG